MHVHVLNIPCKPPLQSNLNIWLFHLPLLLVQIIVSGIRCFHYFLIILIPFIHDVILVHFFTPYCDTPSWLFHWTHVLCLGYNTLMSNIKILLKICFSDLSLFVAHKITHAFIASCTCHHHQIFFNPVLNFFHNFLRILSTVNFMNGRIGAVIISPLALVTL